MPELIVTSFNRNFTGVSATAAGVIRVQQGQYDLRLSDVPLPSCPAPISRAEARHLSRSPAPGRPFTIWHVRRNSEMRAALWARDVLRLPIRIVFTSAAQRRHSALPRWLISRMDAVIATTQAAAAHVPHVRAVIPHGVDCARFAPAINRAAAWEASGYPGTRGIATIGRIRPEKGTDRFVAAMLRLLPDHPGTTALVIGRAGSSHRGFLDRLKRQTAEAGLSDRLLFPGEIAPDALPALLRALTLVVQLPRYEGYGMTALEAMASGVPFVASDTGHFREFARGDRAGCITADPETTLATLLRDPDRLSAMSLTARATAHAHFDVTQEAQAIGRVYEALWTRAPPDKTQARQ
ncbi:mannosylfructose-phosphate synthase [Roseovarius sp. A-2]|uniref:glycosyltransferase family 4 protein n=1 Tax=Roseovarius sp. A-2 TaxID=1570360 RepID=UPI0009B53A9D|nr:glycosyltransferase family 4 protein [Roseovarius sp. A-2]GAW33992.1 mannosylfructose-phosphate synthase [Roseovarius sp. A-2]